MPGFAIALLPLLFWLSAAPAAAQDARDRSIVAGEWVGAVRAASTAAQWREAYEAATVRASTFDTGEGKLRKSAPAVTKILVRRSRS